MEKTISISALVVAVAASVVAVTKPDVTKMVAATQGEDDRAVAAVVQSSGVNATQCCRDWADIGHGAELVWLCSDVGYSPDRQTWLTKKAGEKGQCISFDPAETANGVAVKVVIQEGASRAQPVAAVAEAPIEEPKEP